MFNDLTNQHAVERFVVDFGHIDKAPSRRFIQSQRCQFMRHATVAQKHIRCLSLRVDIELAQSIFGEADSSPKCNVGIVRV